MAKRTNGGIVSRPEFSEPELKFNPVRIDPLNTERTASGKPLAAVWETLDE